MAWHDWILNNELILRLAAFFGVFACIALWELRAPQRVLQVPKASRWASNLGLVFLNSLVLRWLFPTATVGVALFAEQQGWGLLPLLGWSTWMATLAAVVMLDFAIWLQHVMFHAVPLLWRLHQVHHADLDYDVTTGARFHTIEIVLSMGIKFAVVALLGPPVVAVVLFEILLNATAMFNHGNIRLPNAVDRHLRWFLVTPDMHRVHHSVVVNEANSNFGFSLSCWDRVFGTYRAEPEAGQQGMIIGTSAWRDPKHVNRLPAMLWLPFRRRSAPYAINQRQAKKTL